MTEMIERIARGLAAADFRGDDWQQYTDRAVGVLRLMREPTDWMIVEGDCKGDFHRDGQSVFVWYAMIDEALEGKEGKP